MARTYETIDGKFVSEDPGIKNRVLGYDQKGNKIFYGSSLCNYKLGYEYHPYFINKVDCEMWLNYYIREGYTVISDKLYSIYKEINEIERKNYIKKYYAT